MYIFLKDNSFEKYQKQVVLLVFGLLISTNALWAQDDLDAILNETQTEKTEYIRSTFKSSRIINLHSPEKVAPGALEFRISHRFGPVNGGFYQYWGLDQATMRMGFEYGINDWIMVGIARSTYQKTYDGLVKANITRQSTGKKNMPLSILYMGAIAINGMKFEQPDRENYFSSRVSYTHQFIFARKFNDRFSAEFAPTVIHRNFTADELDANDMAALGFGGRMKLTKRTAFNAEYIVRVKPKYASEVFDNYHNSFSIGFDIETGGHVFQLHITNSLPMFERGFMLETTDSWGDGGIHFGFNITREFNFGKKKDRKS
jgi:Membrane bound beta barrel domain (DUF5777)